MNYCMLAVAAGALIAPATVVSAQQFVLTGNQDFSISNVGEGFIPSVTRRNAVNSRFQINGRNPNSADRNFGLWASFDVDFSTLLIDPISQLESVTIDLFQAQPTTGQDINNIITGGNINVYFSLVDDDVLDSANGYDWIDSDPEGLGNQFADRVLVDSINLATGNFDASFDVDLSSVSADIINQINSGGFFRFIFTTPDQDVATSFGVGAPGTSTILAFDGDAPTITFNIPSPGAASLLAVAALAATRRRR